MGKTEDFRAAEIPSSVGHSLRKIESQILFPVRAKYYTQPDGSLRLANIQIFAEPRFREDGWELEEKFQKEKKNKRSADEDGEEDDKKISLESDIRRATRRAKIRCFDAIMCNKDMDLFLTVTYSPEKVTDKADYDECYKYLSVWLSNRVQRKGLKYVCVPERTRRGDIHFHMICNSSAFDLIEARSPKGRLLKHDGKQLYNVPEWKRGFTSAEYITRKSDTDDERAMVAKYIFKYMGKQMGAKIGGRYVLSGGEMRDPVYLYGDSADAFLPDEEPKYKHEVSDGENYNYTEYGFI